MDLEPFLPVLLALAVTLPVEIVIVHKLLQASKKVERVPQQTKEIVRHELKEGGWDREVGEMLGRVVEQRIGRAVVGGLRRLEAELVSTTEAEQKARELQKKAFEVGYRQGAERAIAEMTQALQEPKPDATPAPEPAPGATEAPR